MKFGVEKDELRMKRSFERAWLAVDVVRCLLTFSIEMAVFK